MRVLNLLNSNHRRGAEAFGVDLGHALDRRGVETRTVALTEAVDGARFEVPTVTDGSPWRWSALRALHAHVRWADVVIGHGGATLFAGAATTTASRTPFVYRVIGEPAAWADTGPRRLRVRTALRAADAVAVYHAGVAAQLVDRFGVPASRIVTIPKGIDTTAIAPATATERRAAREALGVAPDARVVLVLGALVPAKNVEQLIDAAVLAEDVTLLIVGDGPHRAALAERGRPLGGRCIMPPATADPSAVLHAADALALTSRTEGVPTVVLEAGLAGLPVVATPVGGIGSVVVHGQTGLLVPLDDVPATARALERVTADPGSMGAAARARVLAEHAIEPVAARWEGLLTDVVATRRPGPTGTPSTAPDEVPADQPDGGIADGPRFTVAVATYNHAARLPSLIASVLDQTFTDFELVVVDDGSVDDTADRVAAVDDPRVRYVHRPNGGISAARNTGTAAATGQFLVFLDDDDRPERHWLEAFDEVLRATGAVISTCGATFVDRDGVASGTRLPPPPAQAASALSAMAGTFCVRRDVLTASGGFVEGLAASHQTELWLRLREVCAPRGWHITSVREPLIRIERRGSDDRETRSPEQVFQGGEYILAHHRAILAEQPGELANYLATVGVAAARTGRLGRARRLFADAARADPRRPKHLARLAVAMVPPVARRVWGA